MSKTVDVFIDVPGVHPYEGAYLLEKFLRNENGRVLEWVPKKSINMFSGRETEEDPATKDLEIAPGVFESFNWGQFKISDIEGTLDTGYSTVDDMVCFQLRGKIDGRQKTWLMDIIEKFKPYADANSIYRNRAIILDGLKDGGFKIPKFINTAAIKTNEYILNDNVAGHIDLNINTIIEKHQQCKEYGVPVKRGILLTGPYGTGKTLVARQTARVTVENGWSFILVKQPSELALAFKYAQRFSPAVVFVEDVDAAFTSDHRDEDSNEFLNTFDNIYSKGSEVMFIMTTNHPEQLSKPMLRPGRIDSVIQFELPNTESIEKLISYFAGDLLRDNTEQLRRTAIELSKLNITPSVIRELVERAKLQNLRSATKPSFYSSCLPTLYKEMSHHLDLLEKAIDLGVKKKGVSLEENIQYIVNRIG